MLTLTPHIQSLVDLRSGRHATCWKIERSDGIFLYFAAYDCDLVLEDGETYQALGGFQLTARRREGALKTHNLDVSGFITSSLITEDDLDRKVYDNAEITEYMVDPVFPWAGALRTAVYWIGNIRHTSEGWQAEIEGLTKKLRLDVGEVFSRNCRYDFGDTKCGIDITPGNGWAWTSVAVSTVDSTEPARKFNVSSIAGSPEKEDYWFDQGKITWLTGNNAGIVSDVKRYLETGLSIELSVPLPFDIQVGDTLTIVTGCSLEASVCKEKFSNLVRFGGQQFIPGTDDAMRTPNAI